MFRSLEIMKTKVSKGDVKLMQAQEILKGQTFRKEWISPGIGRRGYLLGQMEAVSEQ